MTVPEFLSAVANEALVTHGAATAFDGAAAFDAGAACTPVALYSPGQPQLLITACIP